MVMCWCGCGEAVQRRYLSGHDRRHTARLVREVRSGNTTVEQAHAELDSDSLAERFDQHLADARP